MCDYNLSNKVLRYYLNYNLYNQINYIRLTITNVNLYNDKPVKKLTSHNSSNSILKYNKVIVFK